MGTKDHSLEDYCLAFTDLQASVLTHKCLNKISLTLRTKDHSLEDYCLAFTDLQASVLTHKCLNKMINIQGFMTLHRRPKKDLIDALNTIDIQCPYRSTLQESISCDMSLSLDEITKDLETLDWQECLLQSIKTLNASNGHDSIVFVHTAKSPKGKRKKKCKRVFHYS